MIQPYVYLYKTFCLQLVNQALSREKNYTFFLTFFHIGP